MRGARRGQAARRLRPWEAVGCPLIGLFPSAGGRRARRSGVGRARAWRCRGAIPGFALPLGGL
eukprot:252951-Pyramimonas_sp.AAC.1